ncbi:MAG: hypothetical protein ACRYG6_13840 [Janthinobacterium lividum]
MRDQGQAAGGETSGGRAEGVPGGGGAAWVGRRGLLMAAPGMLVAGAARGAPVPQAPRVAPVAGSAAGGAAAAGAGVAATVRVRPGGVADLVTLRAEGARSRLLLDGEPVLLPGAPERIAALPVAGRQVVVAGVALPSGQVLAVLAGWDGTQVRVLGVESWDWHGSGPRRLGLRLAAVPDDRRVRLLYEAVLSTPKAGGPEAAGRVVVRREAWTDVLAWEDGGAMRSEPLRPVLAGTWQARMAGTRAAVAALLAAPCTDVGVEALAATGLLDPLGRVAPG